MGKSEPMILDRTEVEGITISLIYHKKGKWHYLVYTSHTGGERSTKLSHAQKKFRHTVEFFQNNRELARELVKESPFQIKRSYLD